MKSVLFLVLYIIADASECPISNDKWALKLSSLEHQYREQRGRGKLTVLFGHIHHAGGTAVCQLARNNTIANPTSNCNHPKEFTGNCPVTASVAAQLHFQKTTPWKFYAVELKMPYHMIFGGPLLYALVMRHPYLLLLSLQRRAKVVFNLDMSITEFVAFQSKKAGVKEGIVQTMGVNNTLRGQAGFILGRYGPTHMTDGEIFEAAKRRIDRISVLLLTEDMEMSGKLFQIKLGWDVGNFGQSRVNSHGDLSSLIDIYKAMPHEDKLFMKQHTDVDMQLYRYARCTVQRELSQAGMSLRPYELDFLDEMVASLE